MNEHLNQGDGKGKERICWGVIVLYIPLGSQVQPESCWPHHKVKEETDAQRDLSMSLSTHHPLLIVVFKSSGEERLDVRYA